MGLKSQKTRRSEQFRNHINHLLENRGDHADDEWWEDAYARDELVRLSCADTDCVSDAAALNIESSEKLIFAVYKQDINLLFDQISEKAEQLDIDAATDGIHLIFFVQGMRDRIQLEKSFSAFRRNKLAAIMKAKSAAPKLQIRCTYVIDHEYQKQTLSLKNVTRHEIMHIPPISSYINREASEAESSGSSHKNALHALVFELDLIQLVEIYDIIGDQLFKNNVRFGINEMLGVDRAICKTLEEEPDHFWYKNNGITILIENGDMRLKSLETLPLGWIGPEMEPAFSVINGAQTITASARYFFDLELQCDSSSDPVKKKRLEEKLENSKRAKVMVKMIFVPEEDHALAKEISVALNRQKPVEIEDIVFTTPFVEKLADYLNQGIENKQTDFRITRRGDESFKNQQMELISFARARKACIGKPGDARSQGANTLLSFQADDKVYTFKQKDIFVDQWMEAEEEHKEEVFRRFYGAVWFAQQAALKYDKVKKQIKTELQDNLTVIKNGKWYFTAILVQLLNNFSGGKTPDFTNFDMTLKKVEDQFSGGIKKFAALMVYYVNVYKKNEKLDSNLFKKNDCYKGLIQKIEHVYHKSWNGQTSEDVILVNLINEFTNVFCEPCLEKNSGSAEETKGLENVNSADAAASEKPGSIVNGKYIELGRCQTPVNSMAEGMQKTTAYILNNYPQVQDQLDDDSIAKWLTNDQKKAEKKDGYFRNRLKEIKTATDTYWIGTTSNIHTKKAQMNRLCEMAMVQKGEISWYNGPNELIFAW